MGNCVSACKVQENVISPPRIRVVQAGEGRVVEVEVPDLQMSMKVGELMLEFPPGHFLALFDQADFSGNNNIRRASPLGADAEAKSGLVYVLFPMPRLHTRVAPHELSAFAKLLHLHDHLSTAKSTPKKQRAATGGARVAPLADEDEDEDGRDGNTTTASNAMAARPSCQALGLMFAQQQQQQNEQESLTILCPDSPHTRSCHGHIQVIKSKPWAPELETIKESS